jgi:threonine dehydrogenase-like Zn-dependent dehydrogenase
MSASDHYPQVTQAFASGELSQVKKALDALQPQTAANGATVLPEFIGTTDCVRYVSGGIEFQAEGREIKEPAPDEVMLLATSVSLCGTDVDLIKKAQANQLPVEAMGKVVGHEAAGFVVGVGANVTDWQIGQMVCLDSHFACGRPGHDHFDDCVHSGQSCDGIVGGIRGELAEDGHRQEPRDGYWSRVMVVPASALPLELPVAVAQHLTAPSTLESLGNIYMIVGELEKQGLLENPGRTALVVSGLGATGYPMAAVAKHYGFHVVGVNPSEGKRVFAQTAGAIDESFATTAELLPHFKSHLDKGEIDNFVIVVMSGHEAALEDALAVLNDAQLTGAKRRACIIFGLYSDAQKPMPGMPAGSKPVPQRDFVFSRMSYTSDNGVEVYGVCGRDLKAWQMLMKDLQPDSAGNPPALATMLNKAIYTLPVADPLQEIAETLNKGAKNVEQVLREHQALKLAANLVVKK